MHLNWPLEPASWPGTSTTIQCPHIAPQFLQSSFMCFSSTRTAAFSWTSTPALWLSFFPVLGEVGQEELLNQTPPAQLGIVAINVIENRATTGKGGADGAVHDVK